MDFAFAPRIQETRAPIGEIMDRHVIPNSKHDRRDAAKDLNARRVVDAVDRLSDRGEARRLRVGAGAPRFEAGSPVHARDWSVRRRDVSRGHARLSDGANEEHPRLFAHHEPKRALVDICAGAALPTPTREHAEENHD